MARGNAEFRRAVQGLSMGEQVQALAEDLGETPAGVLVSGVLELPEPMRVAGLRLALEKLGSAGEGTKEEGS